MIKQTKYLLEAFQLDEINNKLNVIKDLVFSGSTNRLILDGIASSGVTDGSVIRAGTSSSPLVDDQAGAGFIVGYFDSGATSGWPAGLFISTNVTGAGGSFTALQGDAVLTVAKATVTGIENFMQLSTGGKVTGACRSVQGTIDFSNEDKGSGGVYSAACFNIKGEGSACDVGTTQRVQALELKTEGTFSANAGENFQTKTAGYMIYFNGFTAASGTGSIVSSSSPNPFPAGTYGIRVGIGADGDAGSAYYIPLLESADWTVNRLDLVNVSSSGVTDGSVIRMGTSGSPLVDDQAGAGFIVGYFDSGATSGWPAGLFISTDVTGVGGSFTALQGDAVIKAAKATVTGIESFMQLVSPGKVTGAARACQATVDFGNYQITTGGGVYSGACFNMKGEGSSCDPSLAQRMSCLELKTEGTYATGKDFEKQNQSYAIYFNGFSAAAGITQILTSTTLTIGAGDPANVVGIRVGVGGDGDAGTAYYIPLVPASEWN